MGKKTIKPPVLIIYGPTGVGKTEIALSIAHNISAEIINMDVGQFYTPLSIGTAKPDWRNSPVPHHLFDIINEPYNLTVVDYRLLLQKKINAVIGRGNLPIIVGGSGFYARSIFYPPQEPIKKHEHVDIAALYSKGENLWNELYVLDPERALLINKSDTYRVTRALEIWHTTGNKPTALTPTYSPENDFLLLFLTRDTQELNGRINHRVLEMIKNGWVEEAKNLIATPWHLFIEQKKLIGYNEIFDFLGGNQSDASFAKMVDVISAKTRQYAKRQRTFWRKMEREIKKESMHVGKFIGCLESLNLTDLNINLYINELLKRLAFFL